MTYQSFMTTLAQEYQSRHEGHAPAGPQLLREPWIGRYLAVMFPAPVRPLYGPPLCLCGHEETEHPLLGGCAGCGCLGYDGADTASAVRQEA